jgi:hypothetical protein
MSIEEQKKVLLKVEGNYKRARGKSSHPYK